MKKLVLGLAIALGGLSAQSTMAATANFSAATMAQHTLSKLTFKELVYEFYKNQMSVAKVLDKELATAPYVGLGGTENGHKTVAVMHPLLKYKNTKGQPRYLAVIEKLRVNQRDGMIAICQLCEADADLFIFKKLRNGSYQLVSRSSKDTKFHSSWGRVRVRPEVIKDNLHPLGKNLMGSIYKNGYFAGGISEEWWVALHLSEDDYIRLYTFGDAGGDSSGYFMENSPKSYTYTATYEVLPDNSKYYPIKITYSGTKENWDKGGRVGPTNDSEVVRFNEQLGNYE